MLKLFKPMKILEIHEVRDEFLNPDLYKCFDIITFDDGLYTQYKHRDFFKSLNKRCIFFISSGIICSGVQNTNFVTCADAHNHFFDTNSAEYYMTFEQIQELQEMGFEIGWHLHNHLNFNILKENYSCVYAMKKILQELEKGQEFIKTFNVKSMCFPYNIEIDILKHAHKFDFYGPKRTSIEKLLNIDVKYPEISKNILNF